jgi:hypothetical protein
MIKRPLLFGGYILFCLACFVLAFEVIYRYQVIDFYQPELKANNRPEDLKDSNRKTLMAMGDSFSAGDNTWVGFLRAKLPSYRVISAAVSATGVFESLYLAPRRFREFKPQFFIYQVYVGNDLQDIRRPLNWRTMTLPRYTYGYVCSYMGLRSLIFANYRLAQLFHNFKYRKVQIRASKSADPPFDPNTYLLSARIYTRASPFDLEDTVLARGERGRDLTTLIGGIKKLVSYAGRACRNYLVVIPDAGQVSDFYLDHLKQLGARVSNPQELHRDDYPLLIRLQEGLAEQKIEVLNPLPLFKTYERQGRRLYYRNDPHLKPVGQYLLGEFILERLKADGLAP